MRVLKCLGLCCIILCLNMLIVTNVTAQTTAFDYGNRNYFRWEGNKAVFKDVDDVGFLTSAHFITGHYSFNNKWGLSAELPLSIADVSGTKLMDLGNLMFTLNYYAQGGKFKGELGVGLPSPGIRWESIFNIFVDPTEHPFSLFSDIVPVRLMGMYSNTKEIGFGYSIRGGFESGISLDEDIEVDLLFGLSALLGYIGEKGKILGGVSTFTNLTGEDLDSSERTVKIALIRAEMNFGEWRPGLVVRLPLDDNQGSSIQYSAGLSLAYFFN